jgi:virginiamycin B lyase
MIAGRTGRRRVGLALAAVLAAVAVAAVIWRTGWSDPGFVEYRARAGTDIPTALAPAADGAVWFTLEMSDAIGVIRNGRMERLSKPTPNLEPLGLAADPAGGAWYTDTVLRAISRISSGGAIQSFPLPTAIVRLGRLAMGPDGSVWFADATTSSVTRLKDGVFTRHEPRSPGAAPFGVAVDARGEVWATLQNANKLLRIAPDGEIREFDVPSPVGALGDVVIDGAGAVWFADLHGNTIYRFVDARFTAFPIPTPAAGLTALAVAPDAAVWFTELRLGRLGRLRDGRMTEFRLPRPDARPFGVAVDAANNVWYTDLGGWVGMLPARRAKGWLTRERQRDRVGGVRRRARMA